MESVNWLMSAHQALVRQLVCAFDSEQCHAGYEALISAFVQAQVAPASG